MNFILSKLEVHIREVDEPLENFILRGSDGTTKCMLIFVCGVHRNCFTSSDRLKIAAIFVIILSIYKIFHVILFVYLQLYLIQFAFLF